MGALGRRAGLRLFRLFSRPLEPSDADRLPSGMALRLIEPGEVLELCEDGELDLSRDKVTAAFARGDVCVGAFDARGLTGYCWLAFAPLPHLDGAWVSFDQQAVWTYKSFVRPGFRGRGIAPALYKLADRLCVQRGRGSSIICVESHNGPSVAAARRAGYGGAGYAAYLLWERRLLAWCSPAAERAGVRFYLA